MYSTLVTQIKPGSNKEPNMRDVASAAGVSLSTVSLVVNGKPGVSPDRRERVLEAIREVGYIVEGRQMASTELKVFGIRRSPCPKPREVRGFIPGLSQVSKKQPTILAIK